MYPRNDIGTISCENGTSNVRKKNEPPNVTKSTVKCDVGTP